MAHNAKGQQTRRLAVASLLSMLPMIISGGDILSAKMILVAFISVLWMLTYPLLYHLTNRKSSPDYENYMDIAFGLYLFGGFSGLLFILQYCFGNHSIANVLISLLEIVLLAIPLFQIIYYITYHVCVDSAGMKTIQETDKNEILEFFHSFSLIQNIAAVLPVIASIVAIFYINFNSEVNSLLTACTGNELYIRGALLVGITVFLLHYTWKKHHGVFGRTGIANLFSDVKEYINNNKLYSEQLDKRLADLHVEQLGKKSDKPSTIIFVIGESGCRDFMSAFHEEMEEDTTPWLRECKKDKEHFFLFPNAYSCSMQTVPSLERALTEFNQYNDKQFYESCSIVDIAHKLGYRVHWYSNQGHLGTFDTPITLVADTADVAKWTNQEVGKVQYDESLLDFFDEIDPTQNNFVVLHLIGSHFNFQNRYPKEFTRWGNPEVQDNVVNYKNSIAYTDSILQKFYEYGKEKLNLQAMIYCSDHATEPGRRRKPNFEGFQMTRIPMFVYTSDSYREAHPERVEALRENENKYFTNDLLYELICGIFDVKTSHFEEQNSLSSKEYKYTRDMLLTYEGRKHISEDQEG